MERKLSVSAAMPYGFIILTLLFHRTLGSFTDLPLSYQLASSLASASAWILLCFLEHAWHLHRKVFFSVSALCITAAFLLQEYVIVAPPGSLFFEFDRMQTITLAAVLLAIGYAVYCRLWLSVFEKMRSDSALICIAVSSGLSALFACVPPLLFGVETFGILASFGIRVILLLTTFWALHNCLQTPLECFADMQEDLSDGDVSSSLKDVLKAVSVVVLAMIVGRFSQGIISISDMNYKEFGAQLLLIASPTISICTVLLARKYGNLPNFVSLFYRLLVIFAAMLLLVPAAVADAGSPVEGLWVFQFASYAQFDIVFMGTLASISRSFGPRYYRFICLAFASKELAFALGFAIKASAPPFAGNMVGVFLLVAFLGFAIFDTLFQVVRDSSSKESMVSILDALIASLAHSYKLTSRERDVLELLLQGRSYANISRKLFISVSTVKTHVNHIFAKIGVGTRDELIDLLNPFEDEKAKDQFKEANNLL